MIIKFRFILMLLFISCISGYCFAEDKDLFSALNPNAFEIKSKSKILQKYGFNSFCKTTHSYGCAPINYKKYVGMKGYFANLKPIHNIGNYEFRSVALENGEKFYYVSRHETDLFDSFGEIENLAEIKRHKNRVGEAVVPNSKINISEVKRDVDGGIFYYHLNNGAKFTSDQYELAQRILNKIRDEKKRDEFLRIVSEFVYIKYDKIDNRYFLNSKTGDFFPPLSLYISLHGAGTWLRMKANYEGEDWIFAESYLIVADKDRMELSGKFDRDNGSGKVWEWIDVSPTVKQYNFLKVIPKASEVIIRFRGKYYSDRKLKPEHQKGIESILRIFELMDGKLD